MAIAVYISLGPSYRQPSQPQELEFFFQELFVLCKALYLFEESKLREKFSLKAGTLLFEMIVVILLTIK